MIKKVGLFLISFILVLSLAYTAIADHVVISEVYYDAVDESDSEFVELYNPTGAAVNISGWTINDSSGIEATIPASSSIPSHGFFLIADGGWSAGKDDSTWPNADVEDEMSLANTNNGIVLKNGSNIIDAVGWGSPTDLNLYEGIALASVSNGNSSERKSSPTHNELEGNGWDTNNNSADFVIRTVPQPQNSSNNTEFSQYSPGSDVTPPNTTNVNADSPVDFIPQTLFNVTATIVDPTAQNYSYIAEAELIINVQGVNGSSISMNAVDGSFNDNTTENVIATLNISDACGGICPVGTHTVYVRGKDQADNWGIFNSTTFTVNDVTAPGIINYTSGNAFTGDLFRIWGSATDNVEIGDSSIQLAGDVTPRNESVTLTSSTTLDFEYYVQINSNAASFNYNISVNDTAGNTGKIISPSINVLDNDAPNVTAPTSPTADSWHNSDILVNVAVTDNIGVNRVYAIMESAGDTEQIELTGTPYTGTFTITDLDDGNYNLTINATDNVGNENSSVIVLNISVDDTVPVLTNLMSNMTNNITGSDVSVLFNLTLTEINVYNVTLNAGTTQLMTSAGANTYTYPGTPQSLGCPTGETTCTVTANVTDYATNSNTTSYTFKIDDNAPRITINTPVPSTIYNNDSVNVSALITDLNLNNVTLWENSTGVNISYYLGDSGTGNYSYLISATDLSNMETVSYWFYAIDDVGNENITSAQFTVSNRAPSFNSSNPIANISVNEEQPISSFNITPAFYDVDGDALTYIYVPDPTVDGNLTIIINNATGQVNVTIADPDYFGVSYLYFRAYDPYDLFANSNTIEIRVNNVNDAPRLINPAITLPDMKIPEDSYNYTIDLDNYFYDPDGDPFDYSAELDDGNLTVTIDANNVMNVSPIKDFYGVRNVAILANDYIAGTNSDTFKVNVTSVNDAPVIDDVSLTNESILNLTQNEDFTTFTFDLTPYETDVDDYDVDANLTWNISGVDTSLVNITINATTDIITFQSLANTYGTDTFTLTLNDSFNANDTIDLTITILSVNDDPVINATIPTTYNTSEDVALTINLKPYETDVDLYDNDANLTWSVTGVNLSLMLTTIDSVNDVLIVNPVLDQSGSDAVTLTLTDSMAAFDTQGITININPVNDAPVIHNSPNTTATQGQLYTYEMNATDVENNPLTYIVNDTARFAKAGNVFTWTPTQADVDLGTIAVNFSVSDGIGTASIVAVISTNNQNDAPVIQTIADQTAYDDVLFTYQVNATDADGDAITFSLSDDSPFNMEINSSSGLIQWIPDDVDLGQNTVTVIAKDPSLEEDRETFNINVLNTNDAPTIPILLSPANNSIVTTAANSTLLNWNDSIDVDNNSISYNLYLRNNSDILLNGISVTPSEYNLAGLIDGITYYWYVIATDGTLSSPKSEEWQFSTSFDNTPVIINPEPLSNPTITETESIIFNATLYDVDGNNMLYNWSINGATNLTGTTTSYNQTVSFTFNTDYNSSANSPYALKLEIKDTNNNAATPQQWTVTVTNLNRAPSWTTNINDTTLNEDFSTFTHVPDLSTYVTDIDGDTIAFSISAENNSQVDCQIAGNQLILNSATDWNGGASCSVRADDGNGGTVNDTFVITVNNTNDAPVINAFYPLTTAPVIAATTGSEIFNISATDPDSDPLTYAWWLNGNSTGITTSTYTTGSLPAGSYNVTAVVSDANISVSQYWNLVASAVPLSGIYTGTLFSQADLSNAVNVTIVHPTYGSIDFGNQTLDLTGFVDVDRYVNINNGIAGIDSSSFPVFSSLSSPVTITMTGLSYPLTPILYYSPGFTITGNTECPSNICSNKSYDASAGVFTFTIPNFSVFWLGANTSNQPPTITSSPKTTAIQFREYSYDVDATDIDNDAITYSLLAVCPSGMSISSSSGLITWTPNATGNYNTVVAATAGNHTTTQSFNISVSKGSRLLISKVDAKVDGKSDKDLDDGDTISKEAAPEDDVEFKIELENLYSDEDDLKIEDITVTVEIRDIDDGDDLEEESSEFDLNPEKDKRVTLDFKIPLEVDEDTYEVEIKAEGEDENNTELETTFTIYLEVKKKNHEIRIRRVYLNPSEISCQRTTRLETSIINTGSNDEDDVSLRIENTALNINKLIEGIELDEGTDDNTYENSYTFDIADDVSAGTYPISIKTYYDSRSSGYDTVELNVKDCIVEKKVEKEHKVTVKTIEEEIITDITKEPVEKPVTEITFRESASYLMLIILLYIAVTATGMFMFVYLINMKKRQR